MRWAAIATYCEGEEDGRLTIATPDRSEGTIADGPDANRVSDTSDRVPDRNPDARPQRSPGRPSVRFIEGASDPGAVDTSRGTTACEGAPGVFILPLRRRAGGEGRSDPAVPYTLSQRSDTPR